MYIYLNSNKSNWKADMMNTTHSRLQSSIQWQFFFFRNSLPHTLIVWHRNYLLGNMQQNLSFLKENFIPCPSRKISWMYFPKRLELSFMAVRAFPKASNKGLTWRICCSSWVLPRHNSINCLMISLVLSVFPAPLSPLRKAWKKIILS